MPRQQGWSRHPEGLDHSSEERSSTGLSDPVQPPRVISVGAICDIDFRAGASGTGSAQSFSVREFVALEDGRRVILHGDRGFTLGSNMEPVRSGLTSEIIRHQVLNVVLPEDEHQDDHPWRWLAELAKERGIDVTAEDLKELQYEVVLAESVNRWLATS